jgi:hypothetical protein
MSAERECDLALPDGSGGLVESRGMLKGFLLDDGSGGPYGFRLRDLGRLAPNPVKELQKRAICDALAMPAEKYDDWRGGAGVAADAASNVSGQLVGMTTVAGLLYGWYARGQADQSLFVRWWLFMQGAFWPNDPAGAPALPHAAPSPAVATPVQHESAAGVHAAVRTKGKGRQAKRKRSGGEGATLAKYRCGECVQAEFDGDWHDARVCGVWSGGAQGLWSYSVTFDNDGSGEDEEGYENVEEAQIRPCRRGIDPAARELEYDVSQGAAEVLTDVLDAMRAPARLWDALYDAGLCGNRRTVLEAHTLEHLDGAGKQFVKDQVMGGKVLLRMQRDNWQMKNRSYGRDGQFRGGMWHSVTRLAQLLSFERLCELGITDKEGLPLLDTTNPTHTGCFVPTRCLRPGMSSSTFCHHLSMM